MKNHTWQAAQVIGILLLLLLVLVYPILYPFYLSLQVLGMFRPGSFMEPFLESVTHPLTVLMDHFTPYQDFVGAILQPMIEYLVRFQGKFLL